jgi:hypothetical protein
VDCGDPYSSLVAGRDLNAPNAPSFLLDACTTMHNFQDHVDILFSQFSTLQSAKADNYFASGQKLSSDCGHCIAAMPTARGVHTVLLERMKHMGMNTTRNRFTYFVSQHIKDIFNITLEQIVNVFER